jgi:hypothetical protein
MIRHNPRAGLFPVFLLALVARLGFIAVVTISHPETVTVAAQITPEWNELGVIAHNLAQGRGFNSPFDSAQPTAWLCPALPFLWAGILLLAGDQSSAAVLLAWSLQAVVSSLAVVGYVAVFQRLLAGRAGRRAAVVWAIVVALWPESILRITELWYYPWQELGVALLVWQGMRWFHDPSSRNAALLGGLAGATALINITPMPLFLLAVGGPLATAWSAERARRAALAGAIAAAMVTPWIVRQSVVFQHFIPLRGNAGVELWQGNNPRGAIRQTKDSVHPGIDVRELEAYREWGEYEYNQRALRNAMAWIRTNPLQFASNAAKRAYVAWCSDLTDRWSWDGRKWWRSPDADWFAVARQLVSSATALATLVAALAGVWLAGVRSIRYRHLIFGAPLTIPLPHYFTQIDPAYVASTRVWLLMIAVACVVHLRRPPP